MSEAKIQGRGLKVALTGGIGCGKSETGRLLEREGAAVRDADDVAHGLLAAGTAEARRIVERFGSGILDEAGGIDRRKLAARVFANADERAALEAILHPPVARAMAEWAEERSKSGQEAVAIIPLLFEAGLDRGWDATVCVAAEERWVVPRLLRKGMGEADVRARMAAQMPVEEKAARSDYVIRNDGTKESLEEEVHRVWTEILKRKGRRHARSERT